MPEHERPAVLAVDGGNSKTDLLLLDAEGALLASLRWGTTSHQVLGLEAAHAELSAAVAAVAEAAGRPDDRPVADVGAFCLAGLDLPVDDREVGGAVARTGFVATPILRNDTFAVLRAGSDVGWGVALVCGAGMNAVGQAPDGQRVRFPALGAISGDRASGGHWLGEQALGAAVRATDGRGEPTLLAATVPAHFGLDEPADVTAAVYTGLIDEHRLTELAPVVVTAADRGDDVAGQLLDAVADEVVAFARATITRLGMEGPIPVVLGGGLFRSGSRRFLDRVHTGVLAHAHAADLRVLDAPPVVGAALLGFDHLGAAPEVLARVVARRPGPARVDPAGPA